MELSFRRGGKIEYVRVKDVRDWKELYIEIDEGKCVMDEQQNEEERSKTNDDEDKEGA